MDYFARGYDALRAAPQSASDTIDKLCTVLERADSPEAVLGAVLGLKGLSRDWNEQVGTRAVGLLVGTLEMGQEVATAAVETLGILCDASVPHCDAILAGRDTLPKLVALLEPSHFYLRFFTLQLLTQLLAVRPQPFQTQLLTAPGALPQLLITLDDQRELIRNEALLLVQALAHSNPDIQHLLAFEGVFDRLLAIIQAEGGIAVGGIIVHDCLDAIGALLRWNVSNQNYFRETSCIPLLAPLLLFPSPKALTPASLSGFAFQSWSEQKVVNASLVISLVRMLVGGAGTGRAGNQKVMLQCGLSRCLAELALASNAPAVLKSQSLNALADILRLSPPNQAFFETLSVTPLIPPSASDPANPGAYEDDKWHRGSEELAVLSTVDLGVHGDGTPGREGLRVRAGAVALFESFVGNNETAQLSLLKTMTVPSPDAAAPTSTAGSLLLSALRNFPSPTSTSFDSYVPFFASLLFSSLLAFPACKAVALEIYYSADDALPNGAGEEDDRASLVSILVGNFMLALKEAGEDANRGLGGERARKWARVEVGYLCVLGVWMWECPAAARDFLSEGSNLQVLIQPITQSSGVDSLVQGLCAFLLGTLYEFNTSPGPINRETLYPILNSRVGADQFVSRILRLREDERFRDVGVDVLELTKEGEEGEDSGEGEGEGEGVWFDYSFVEFFKGGYSIVQRAILRDPNSTESSRRSNDTSETNEMLQSLRATVTAQLRELGELRTEVEGVRAEKGVKEVERTQAQSQILALQDQVAQLDADLASSRAEAAELRATATEAQDQKSETEKEMEDLLVLLEELSAKRRTDKIRMRDSALEVSEDEDDDE